MHSEHAPTQVLPRQTLPPIDRRQISAYLQEDFNEWQDGRVTNILEWGRRMGSGLRALDVSDDHVANLSDQLDEASYYAVMLGYKPAKDRKLLSSLQDRISFVSQSFAHNHTIQKMQKDVNSKWGRLQKRVTRWFDKDESDLSVSVRSVQPTFKVQNRMPNYFTRIGRLALHGGVGLMLVAPAIPAVLSFFETTERTIVQAQSEIRTTPVDNQIQGIDRNKMNRSFDPELPKGFDILKGNLDDGDTLLRAVHRLWKKQYGVEPSDDQVITATRRWLITNDIYDAILNPIKLSQAKGDSRNLNSGLEIRIPVSGLLQHRDF